MTLICCGKDMPDSIGDLIDDKTEIHTAFRQFAKHRAAGAEVEFMMDVARHRNIKAIYDTYIAREDKSGAAFGFDFGFGDEDEDEVIFQMYPHLRPKEPAKVKPKAKFTLVNKVFSRTKKTKKKPPVPAKPTAPVTPVPSRNAPKTINGQAFGRNGQIDDMLALGRAHNFSEADWRPMLDKASVEVEAFLARDVLSGFFNSELFEKALRTVVERLIKFNASSMLKALPMSSGTGTPSSDDFILMAALVETKMATLLAGYNAIRNSQKCMRDGERYYNSLKSTWGFEMEFWTLKNYLSRF